MMGNIAHSIKGIPINLGEDLMSSSRVIIHIVRNMKSNIFGWETR